MPQAQTINAPTKTAPNNSGIPTELFIHCIETEHLSITDTAKRYNLDKSTVSARLKRAGYIPGYLKNIDSAELSLLKQIGHKLLNHITTTDLKKISLQQATTSYAILTDKQLLLEGKPTNIIAYADLVKARELARESMHAFESKYNIKRRGADNSKTEGVD